MRFYKGVDGLKTGYTEEAGYCLTATANKGFRVIAVVMGEESSQTRNKEVSEMLDYMYAQYELKTLLTKDHVLGKQEVDRGILRYVDIIPSIDVTLLNKKIDKDKNYTYDVSIDKIKAPIKVGDKVGTLYVKADGESVKEIDLTVKENVKKANLFQLYFRYLKETLSFEIR